MSESLLEVVAEVAKLAGAAALEHFRRGVAVTLKADGSPVTDGDRDAERAARAWIVERFPDDSIVGEEFDEHRGKSGRTWLIDPVDGTHSFVHGVPLWGSLIALLEGDHVLAGAAEFPATGERICAARDEGAWAGGSRARVSEVNALDRAAVLATEAAFRRERARGERWRALADRAAIARTWGDAYGYFLVATGRAEVMADMRLHVWDAAPMQVIVEEAGGTFTDWRGTATFRGEGAIATNAALATMVRDVLVGK